MAGQGDPRSNSRAMDGMTDIDENVVLTRHAAQGAERPAAPQVLHVRRDHKSSQRPALLRRPAKKLVWPGRAIRVRIATPWMA
jgi:hypothetical protein